MRTSCVLFLLFLPNHKSTIDGCCDFAESLKHDKHLSFLWVPIILRGISIN